MIKKIRIKKIEQQIYKQISIILQQKIKISNKFLITVTNVVISNNFIDAKIYITILNYIFKNNIKLKEEIQIKKLQRCSKYIRYLLSKILNFKFIPKLIFIYDKSFKDSLYISYLINK